MSALDDHIAHSVWCGVWEAHRNDDGELQSGPCSCDVDRARQELSALRAENARMREALEKCRDVLAGHTMTKQELIDALRSARAALGGRDE